MHIQWGGHFETESNPTYQMYTTFDKILTCVKSSYPKHFLNFTRWGNPWAIKDQISALSKAFLELHKVGWSARNHRPNTGPFQSIPWTSQGGYSMSNHRPNTGPTHLGWRTCDVSGPWLWSCKTLPSGIGTAAPWHSLWQKVHHKKKQIYTHILTQKSLHIAQYLLHKTARAKYH